MKITVEVHKNLYKVVNSIFKIKKIFHKLVIKNNDNETLAYIKPFIETLTEGYILNLYPKSTTNKKLISIATSLNDKDKYIITDLHYRCETIIPHSQWIIKDNIGKIAELNYTKGVLDIDINNNEEINTLEILGISMGIVLNEKSLGKISI